MITKEWIEDKKFALEERLRQLVIATHQVTGKLGLLDEMLEMIEGENGAEDDGRPPTED